MSLKVFLLKKIRYLLLDKLLLFKKKVLTKPLMMDDDMHNICMPAWNLGVVTNTYFHLVTNVL